MPLLPTFITCPNSSLPVVSSFVKTNPLEAAGIIGLLCAISHVLVVVAEP
jgi:hypothetical protein